MLQVVRFIDVYLTIKRSGLFDVRYYLMTYPDVRLSDIDPLKHYILHGSRENKKPSPYFDSEYYLESYPDVKRNAINPLYHYIKFGSKEGRNPSDDFNTEFYLKSNKDVENSGVNPLLHYINRGRDERRATTQKIKINSSICFKKNSDKRDHIAKRVLIYFHYNRQQLLSDYVVFALKSVFPLFSEIIFVSSSSLKSKDMHTLSHYCDKLLEIESTPSQFKAWRAAILHIGYDSICNFDSLTLMSDQSFGPTQDLTELYCEFDKSETQIFGEFIIQNNGLETDNQPKVRTDSLLIFDKSVMESSDFYLFWHSPILANEGPHSTAQHREHLKSLLMRFKCNSNLQLSTPNNSTERRLFIGVNEFLESKHPKHYLQTFERDYGLDYKSELIRQHFNSTYEPNTSSKVCGKTLFVTNSEHQISYKVALHVHVFYVDVLEKILMVLLNKKYLDVYITTSNDVSKIKIFEILDKLEFSNLKNNIFVFENKGRDILPWLKLTNILRKYDVVGHCHTKKSKHYNESWFGDAWMTEMIDTLIFPIDDIIATFERTKELGIVIPEMPYFFKYMMKACPFDGSSGKNRENAQILWDRLGMNKVCDFAELATPIMPYGMMFWYRPLALRKLTNELLIEPQVPEEPIDRDGTVLHALERLPVYVAWSEGYDYRVAVTENSISTGFDYKSNN